jgi:glucose/arabinose dehydrogenase
MTDNVPDSSGGAIRSYSIAPSLPVGLSLDGATGVISGTPSATQAATPYTITARNDAGATTAAVTITVGPALPDSVQSLATGFAAEVVAPGLQLPVKMALAPDGRLFFTELMSGRIRVIDASGNLLSAPFATLPVLTGGHRGLLGIAVAPDFSLSGELFVMVCSPAEPGHADRVRILRFTEVDDVGIDPTVVLDDLPLGEVNNGGVLTFDKTGMLLASLGDTDHPELSQDPASLAGKVMRMDRDGGAPADNPDPGSLEWCRGLRNTFALAVHPVTGGVFGADNGASSDDELDFLQPGKNFEWGAIDQVPGSTVGFKIINWNDVIVPTAMTFHDGTGFGPAYDGNLFLTSYDDQVIRRIVLSGPDATDLDEVVIFAQLVGGLENKPIDILQAADGALWVATFTTIYRIWKL